MLDAAQIHEIRKLVRLEALRAAVFSVASESLDGNTPRLVVSVDLDDESLSASIQFCSASGHVVMGGTL
jgi:hypothetical protein